MADLRNIFPYSSRTSPVHSRISPLEVPLPTKWEKVGCTFYVKWYFYWKSRYIAISRKVPCRSLIGPVHSRIAYKSRPASHKTEKKWAVLFMLNVTFTGNSDTPLFPVKVPGCYLIGPVHSHMSRRSPASEKMAK